LPAGCNQHEASLDSDRQARSGGLGVSIWPSRLSIVLVKLNLGVVSSMYSEADYLEQSPVKFTHKFARGRWAPAHVVT
jgi:hypothetical protein